MTKLTVEERDLLGRVIEKPELQPFFFKKVKGLKWFESLAQNGFFDASRNLPPQPAKEEGYVTVPFWPAVEYLANLGRELTESEDKRYPTQILDIVRAATKHAKKEGFSNYRTWWQFSKIIQNIPVKHIRLDDIKLIDYWLDDPYDFSLVGTEIGAKWLIQLLDSQDAHAHALALRLLDVLFRIHESKTKTGKPRLRFNNRRADGIASNVAAKAGRTLGLDAVDVLRRHLTSALNSDKKSDKWSSIWRRAIEDHEQDQYQHDTLDVLVSAFRDCLSGAIEVKQETASSYVRSLLKGKRNTFSRVAIYMVNIHFHYLAKLVGQLISPKFFESDFRHETWHLLKQRYPEFSDAQKRRVVKLILEHEEKDSDGTARESASVYWKAIWFAALRSHSTALQRQYEDMVRKIGSEPEHPDFSSYMTAGAVVHKSPYSLEELLSLSVDRLASHLADYRDPGGFREPSIEGLAQTVREVVKTEPVRYAKKLKLFLPLDLAYIYQVIEAYHDLWSQNATLPWDDIWGQVLSFCRDLVTENDFWSEQKAAKRDRFVANRYWVVAAIGRLIEDGAKSDDHAFSEVFQPIAEEIVMTLLKRQMGEDFDSTDDAVSIAINSPRGRALEALVNLSLRACRLEDKRHGEHTLAWRRFEPLYDFELGRANEGGEYEFVTLFANYLPNFLYLSKEWTARNLDNVFDKKNMTKWRCAIDGYGYVNEIYPDVYTFLKTKGHYIEALDDDAIKDRIQEKMVQNIVVGYLRGYEQLADANSLIMELITRKKYDEMSHLIWFLWTLRGVEDKELRSRVLALWPVIQGAIDLTQPDGRRIASRLCTWIAFLNEISAQQKALLLAIAPFADETHNAFEFLEGLAKISEKQPADAYDVWMAVLTGSYPDYPEEAMREALQNIARGTNVRNAKNVVDKYLKAGNARPAEILAEFVDH